MRFAIGADGFGFPLKQAVSRMLQDTEHEVEDFGVHESGDPTPYYQTAASVAQRVGSGGADRGILVCGTGMGMCIIANKFPGIYAAVCESTFAAEKSRSINNANILTLGAMVTTPEVARDILHVWLATEFTAGWSPDLQDWLRNSMDDIHHLEDRQFGGCD